MPFYVCLVPFYVCLLPFYDCLLPLYLMAWYLTAFCPFTGPLSVVGLGVNFSGGRHKAEGHWANVQNGHKAVTLGQKAVKIAIKKGKRQTVITANRAQGRHNRAQGRHNRAQGRHDSAQGRHNRAQGDMSALFPFKTELCPCMSALCTFMICFPYDYLLCQIPCPFPVWLS